MKKVFVADIKYSDYTCVDGYVVLASNIEEAKDIAKDKFTNNHSWLRHTKVGEIQFRKMLNSIVVSELDMESESRVFFSSNVGV